MALPPPEPGLVIRYSYLWSEEFGAGSVEGVKDRPCAIILTVEDVDGTKRVAVAPVTHSPPDTGDDAIEIPLVTKERLGLDPEMSWVIVTEVNVFVWPGPDLRPVPGSDPLRFDYGFLPPRLFTAIKEKLAAKIRAHLLRQTARSK